MSQIRSSSTQLIFDYLKPKKVVSLMRIDSAFNKGAKKYFRKQQDIKLKASLSKIGILLKATNLTTITITPTTLDRLDMEHLKCLSKLNITVNLVIKPECSSANLFFLFNIPKVGAIHYSGRNEAELITLIDQFKHSVTCLDVDTDFQISAEFIQSIRNCPFLESLSLTNPKMVDHATFREIYLINTLKSLSLEMYYYNHNMLQGIQNLKNLQELSIPSNCDAESMELISELNYIKTVNIVPRSRNIDMMLALCKIKQIKNISLENINIRDNSIEFAEKAVINWLNLSKCQITANSIKNMHKIKNLNTLSLCENRIDATCAKHIISVMSLRSLELSRAQINFDTWELTKLPLLDTLMLGRVDKSTINFKMFEKLHLTELRMEGCGMDNYDMYYVSKQKDLIILDISENSIDQGLEMLVYCTKLTKLNISAMTTDLTQMIKSICSIETLRYLNISRCRIRQSIGNLLLQLINLRVIKMTDIDVSREEINKMLKKLRLIRIECSGTPEEKPELALWGQLKAGVTLRLGAQYPRKDIDLDVIRSFF